MTDRFEGDPRLYQDQDGSFLVYKAGNPTMDTGLENVVELSLLTTPGWVGNYFLPEESQIGSGFINATRQAITTTALNDIRQEGEKALASRVFGKVTADIKNPVSTQIKANFIIEPSGQEIQKIELTGQGSNWIGQAQNPAYRKI